MSGGGKLLQTPGGLSHGRGIRALPRPLARGILVGKYRKADLDSVWKKNFLIEPKHGVAASDSSEFPVCGYVTMDNKPTDHQCCRMDATQMNI